MLKNSPVMHSIVKLISGASHASLPTNFSMQILTLVFSSPTSKSSRKSRINRRTSFLNTNEPIDPEPSTKNTRSVLCLGHVVWTVHTRPCGKWALDETSMYPSKHWQWYPWAVSMQSLKRNENFSGMLFVVSFCYEVPDNKPAFSSQVFKDLSAHSLLAK